MRLSIPVPVEFSDESFTERGEKVFKTLELGFKPFGSAMEIKRVLACDKGIGITEEWIEETVKGCLEALAKDYPFDAFRVVRHKPNQISFEYAGTRGVVH